MKRILIVKLRPLGDAILAGTCFEAVRQAFPNAWITALVQPPAHELYKKSPWVNEVMAYNRKSLDRKSFFTRLSKNNQIVQAIKKRQFDLAIDLSASHRSAQLITWGKAGFKIGLGLPDIKKFYDLSAPAEDELQVSATELDKRVLGLIGLTPKSHDRSGGYWSVPPEGDTFADTFWKANQFSQDDVVVGINPFASCVSKEWYPEKWAVVIKELLGHGVKLYFTCAPLERKGLEKIEKELGHTLPVYAGSSLLPLMGIYQKSKAVISVDSGPRHLAAAVGTPTLTVWGPEPVERWHPYNRDRHPIALKAVFCRPCGLTVCIERKHECMKTLEPEMVIQALKPLLRKAVGV
ncbi:MAG TPA: glycosyltransferase family 9 protein [bacterium]|nr:glycosyltransferase family 9 protein [bacterium]